MLRSRRGRPVYRVYTEADYLAAAAADPFADRQTPASDRAAAPVARALRRRRLAGAAALTGTVGAVGAAVGLAIVPGRTTGHGPRAEIAASRPVFTRSSPSRARLARRPARRPDRRPKRHGPGAFMGSLTSVRAKQVQATVEVTPVQPAMDTASVGPTTFATPSAAQSVAVAEAARALPASHEFGFER